MVKIKMEPINVSNTTLSLKAGRGHRKFDAKQAKRHDFGEAHCVICDEVFTKYNPRTIVCSEECRIKRRNATRKKYREENREKLNVEARKYREENREKVRAAERRYREENREKVAAKDRIYRRENREKIAVRKRKYREENREKIAAYGRKYREESNYYAENREKRNAKARERYHAKKKEE